MTGDSRVPVFAERCDTCVFWPQNRARLQPGRLADLITANRATGSMLVCHHTTHGQAPQEVLCRGYFDAYADTSRVPQIMAALFGPDWWREVPPPPDDAGARPTSRTQQRETLMTEYRIVVDDLDRDQCPDKPWAASVQDANGEMIGAAEAGLGATIAAAVADALARNYLAGTDMENES